MVDFAAMRANMKADKERRAALSPKARAAEDAADKQRQQAQAEHEEDRSVFAGRSVRALSATLTGEQRLMPTGEMMLSGHNQKGPVQIVLPSLRAEAFRESPAYAALSGAMAHSEDKSGNGQAAVAVSAEGFFRSRNWNDRAGTAHKAWDFVASTVSFSHEGQTHAIGRPVAPSATRETPPPAKAKARQSSGDAR